LFVFGVAVFIDAVFAVAGFFAVAFFCAVFAVAGFLTLSLPLSATIGSHPFVRRLPGGFPQWDGTLV